MDQKRHIYRVISAGERDRQAAKSIALIHSQYIKGKLFVHSDMRCECHREQLGGLYETFVVLQFF